MRRRAMWPRRSPKALILAGVLVGVLAQAACQAPATPAALGDAMPMGPFVLKAVSAEAYSRAHQGVPWEVEVMFTVDGGNRFERDDFANAVNHKGVVIEDASGWSERGWLLWRNDERGLFAVQVTPPKEGHAYTLRIANPYGKPAAYQIELAP